MKTLAFLLFFVPITASAQVFKCEVGGRTIYQEMACEPGTERDMAEDRVTVVDALKRRPTPLIDRQLRRTGSRQQQQQQTRENPHCPGQVKRLARIDAQARQRSTARLAEERRLVVEWINRNKCSRL